MLREINNIPDYYIPYASYTGMNLDAMSPDLRKKSNEIVKIDIGNGIIISSIWFSGWVHITITSSNTMDMAFSGILLVDKNINNHQGRYTLKVYFDFIKMFELFRTYDVENKYNIDIYKLISKLALENNNWYRYYGYTETLLTPVDGTFVDYIAPVLPSDVILVADGFGIGVNVRQTLDSTTVVPDSYQIENIEVNSNITCHFMVDIFSIKNLDLLKKNLKTTYIISPSKYNKINLGGEFDMLRNTYTSPYKRLECDIGSSDSATIEKIGYIKVEFDPLSNISKNDYRVDSSYFHVSVLNNDTLNILGYIDVHFINKPYIKNMYDNYINIYVDMYHMFQNKVKLDFNLRYIDKDFDYNVFREMNSKSRIYGQASLRYRTGTSDTEIIDNTIDNANMYVDSSNQYTFGLTVEDPLVCYCNMIYDRQFYENNKMYRLVYRFDVNIKYFSDVFTHELKKNFKVYYLNNIKHLQNYYIN